MPKTKLHNDFRDFNEVHNNGNDGSYKGMQKNLELINKKKKEEFEKEYEKAKAVLKNKSITLATNGKEDQLYFQGQFLIDFNDQPLEKPKRLKKSFKQLLGVSYPLLADYVHSALNILLTMNNKLATNNFTWKDYPKAIFLPLEIRGIKSPAKTLNELLIEYEKWFLATQDMEKYSSYDRLKRTTDYLKKFPLNRPLDSELIDLIISGRVTNTQERKIIYYVIKKMVTEFNNKAISYNWEKWKDSIKVNNKKTRIYIPEEKIVEDFQKFKSPKTRPDITSWRLYKWMYGMMAVYGLRAEETINITNLDKPFTTPKGTFLPAFNDLTNTEKIIFTDGKTGKRIQPFPYPEEWINLFELTNIPKEVFLELEKYKEIKKQKNLTKGEINRKIEELQHNLVDSFGNYLYNHKFGYTSHDLRHTWCMRVSEDGFLSSIDAAIFAGHSHEMHVNTYHIAVEKDECLQIKRSRSAKQRRKDAQAELEALKAENLELKQKLQLTESRIETLEAQNKLLKQELSGSLSN